MTNAGMANHTSRSKLIDGDPIAVEDVAHRREIERQDHAFVARFRAAILAGSESARGVLGHLRTARSCS